MIERTKTTGLDNWRQWPHSQWAFQHVRELLPTASIGSHCRRENDDNSISSVELNALVLPGPGGEWHIERLHEQTYTDSFIVQHKGQIIHQWHAPHCDPHLPHVVFSISKSITACLAGILADRGIIDFNAPVIHYLPEVVGSAYASCTVQHVLDMNVALDFDENYDEPQGDYLEYRQASGWNPVDQNNYGPDLASFLCNIPALNEPHGQIHRYRSPNSDLLGLLLERAAGQPYASLMSELLWTPMEAEDDCYITLDRSGLARGAGGICTTAYDLARLGRLFLNDGKAGSRQVLPSTWIEDTMKHGNTDAWAKSDMAEVFPGGCYRNKWYQSRNAEQTIWAIGIHGQYLYINPRRSIIIAKTSSQPLPVNDPVDIAVIRSIERLALEIAG